MMSYEVKFLKAEIDALRDGLSKCNIQQMSVSPLTEEKLTFWRQRGVLAEKYYQLGAALEKERAYEDAVRAYWASCEINGNKKAEKRLKLGMHKSNAIPTEEVSAEEIPEEAEACFYLGLRYLGGLGCSQSDARAVAYFRIAAEQGYAPAQSILGEMYINGQGVPRDYAKAINLLRGAVVQRYANAQNALAVMYTKAQGARRDYNQAVNWLREAAEQGNPTAQFNLGETYANGVGVPRDYVQAVDWLRRAAEQGFGPAQHKLGMRYENGQGVPQDYAQALNWYRRAAEQEYAPAKKSRELMYAGCSGPVQAGYAKGYRQDIKNGIKYALAMLEKCKDELDDFDSQYHYAVASYNSVVDKIIGTHLSELIENKANEFFEAVMDDDLLSASERVSFLQKIFEEHRRDKKPSAFSRFFSPAPTSQLTDENYAKLCYAQGSQLYETAELRKYPDKIEKAKERYRQVPKTSPYYQKAMSKLFDLEAIALNWEKQLRDETQSREAREDKLWDSHNAFFQEKDIERGHQALDAYYDSEIYRESPKYRDDEKFIEDLRERNSEFKDTQDKNILAPSKKIS